MDTRAREHEIHEISQEPHEIDKTFERFNLTSIIRSRTVLKYLAVAIVLAFWIAYIWRNWQSFTSRSWELDPALLLAALAFYAGFYVVMGTGWALTLRAMGCRIDFAAAWRVWMVSMPARYLPGTGWHIAGRAYMGSKIGVTVPELLIATYVEQSLAVVSGLLVAVIAALIGGIVLDQSRLYVLITIPIGLTLTHPRVMKASLNLASRFLKKSPVEIKLSYSQVLGLLAWFCLSHVLSGISLFLALTAISPAPLSWLPSIIGAGAFGYVLGLLSILTPGGIGVREATIVVLSTTFVAAPAISAAAFANRFLSILAEAILVAASATASRLFRGKKAYLSE